jgi:hypothetical protein
MPVLKEASKYGLVAMRWLIKHGYTKECDYPYKELVKYFLKLEEKSKDITEISQPYRDITNSMTILEKEHPNINSICEEIITNGIINAMKGIPVLKYANFISVDRKEIEDYRKIYNYFEEYLLNQDNHKPLSVCVFGPPGSGKSFGIEEMVKHFQNIKRYQNIQGFKIQTRIFNLSQFNLDDLSSAFNQIRDISLNGELPIVFWDEFDSEVGSQSLGWLKRFLAPMQDGEYYENADKHSIGRAIFIFAGSVYKNSREIEGAKEKKKENKLPDFLSRIAGSLNIFGLDQVKYEDKNFDMDKLYMVRRAVIIRKIIEKHLGMNENDKMQENITRLTIDNLLNRDHYEHGIRTLESEVKKLFSNR